MRNGCYHGLPHRMQNCKRERKFDVLWVFCSVFFSVFLSTTAFELILFLLAVWLVYLSLLPFLLPVHKFEIETLPVACTARASPQRVKWRKQNEKNSREMWLTKFNLWVYVVLCVHLLTSAHFISIPIVMLVQQLARARKRREARDEKPALNKYHLTKRRKTKHSFRINWMKIREIGVLQTRIMVK